MNLTDIRFKSGGNGQIVLQVCEFVNVKDDVYIREFRQEEVWRDASIEDLLDVADLLRNRWASNNSITGEAE